MAEATDIRGTVFKNGSATLMDRVVGSDNVAIVQGDLASATYTVFLLSDQYANTRTAVDEHEDVALTIADLIFNSLQTDSRWTEDSTGYNFRHVLDVSDDQAFAIAGRRYLVEFTLTPVSGQVILVRFLVDAI